MKKLAVTYTDGKQTSYSIPDDFDLNARLGQEWLSITDSKSGYQAQIRIENVTALCVYDPDATDGLNAAAVTATPPAGV